MAIPSADKVVEEYDVIDPLKTVATSLWNDLTSLHLGIYPRDIKKVNKYL